MNPFLSEETSTAIMPSSSNVFGSDFGKTESKTDASLSSTSSGNIFATGPSMSSSLFAPSQPPKPMFGSGFNSSVASSSPNTTATRTTSSILFNLMAGAKQPTSSGLTFGGFSNVKSSAGPEVSSSNMFGKASGSGGTGNIATAPLTFGMAKPSFDVKSSDSKPLFPVTSQSTSDAFGVPDMNKRQTGATGIFGRAFAAVTGGYKAKENKEKVAEEKIRVSETSTLTALVIKDIPEAYNKNAWLKRFYSRFGEVTKVVCSTAKKSATVAFKTHVSIPDLVIISQTSLATHCINNTL